MNLSFKILLALAFTVTTAQAGFLDYGFSVLINALSAEPNPPNEEESTSRIFIAPVIVGDGFLFTAEQTALVMNAWNKENELDEFGCIPAAGYQCILNTKRTYFDMLVGEHNATLKHLDSTEIQLAKSEAHVDKLLDGLPVLAQSFALLSGNLTGLNPVEVAATKAGVETVFFVIIIPFIISFVYTLATTRGNLFIAINAAQNVAMIVLVGYWSGVISKTEEKMNMLSAVTADNPYVAHISFWMPTIVGVIASMAGCHYFGKIGMIISGSGGGASILAASFEIASGFGVSLTGIVLTGLLILVSRIWNANLLCKTKEEKAELVERDFLRRIVFAVHSGLPKQNKPEAEFMTDEEQQRRMDNL